MRFFCVIVVCFGVMASWVGAQFLNNRPFPTYSLESMPDTGFSCHHRIVGSYYADIETQCQMFHICVRVAGIGVQDFRFLCPNGTAFDQDHQICAEWEDVDCDSSTLYYASDNFDLYRIGSGFESKAVKYGEEEEVFSLQRAETGDIRINRDEQTHRVNQQKDISNFRKPKAPQRNDDEIFKGSSSSNFFNNRNGGKEIDDDEDDKNVNYNQDNNQEQRRKVNRHQSRRPVKQQTAAPQQQEVQTQRPQRPTGFINNFAGSSVVTTAKPSSTTEQYRVRQNVRKQYNNADNFRQSTKNFEDQNYPSTSYTISTPAPFRTQQSNQPTTYAPKKTDYPSTQQKVYTKEPENYPSNFPKQRSSATDKYDSNDNSYDISKVKNSQNYQSTGFEKKPTTAFKQNDHPTTFAPKTAKPSTFNAQNTFPSTFSPRTNSGYTQLSQQTSQQQNNQKYNTQSTQYETQKQNNQQHSSQTTQYNTQPAQRSQNTQYTTQAPQSTQQQNNQQYNSQNGQYNTQTSKSQNTQQYNTQPAQRAQYTTQAPQSTQQQTSQQYNSQNGQYNTQTYKTQNTQQRSQNTQQYTTQAPQSTQQQNNQQYNSQNTQYNTQTYKTQNTQQFTGRTTQLTTSKPSPFTQYTPTVPKITSTTPVSRSNRFDETQYDDGSYNSKYDSYDSNNNNNDEFLKTAHSTNIASSRNELAKTAKATVSTTAKPYYESPRPFSVTQNTPKVTEQPKTTAKVTQAQNSAPVAKKEKNASYDYAYYDTNTQNEPEYEIDTDFKKSTVKN